MKTVRIGYSRLYNARGCSLSGSEEILMRFNFGDIEVQAYVGPKRKHTVLSMKVGPAVPKDERVRTRASRERAYEVPSPEIFPADLYTELIASRSLEVEDALATAFFDQDKAARDQ